MTDATAHQGATKGRAPRRRLLSRIPLWARVSGIIALILVGVFASSMLLGASGVGEGQGGGHGGGGQMQMPHGGSGQGGSGSTHGSGGSHDTRPGQGTDGNHGSGGGR